MTKGFVEFLKKFNVIPVAIGFVLAQAILPVIEALSNVILEIVGKVIGEEDPGKFVEDLNIAGISIGQVLAALITFTLIALVVYLVVKSLNKAGVDTDAGDTKDQQLLTEIRDLLQSRQ